MAAEGEKSLSFMDINTGRLHMETLIELSGGLLLIIVVVLIVIKGHEVRRKIIW